MRIKDPTDWLEDFTIYVSDETIASMASDVEETLVFTGSKPVAAVWLSSRDSSLAKRCRPA